MLVAAMVASMEAAGENKVNNFKIIKNKTDIGGEMKKIYKVKVNGKVYEVELEEVKNSRGKNSKLKQKS